MTEGFLSLSRKFSEQDLSKMLFSRRKSRIAAREFLEWLKAKHGRCSKSEMSQFSWQLASGERGISLGRGNFYRTILRAFIDLGLIALEPEYDSALRRGVPVYRAVFQPVARWRPSSPSIMYVAQIIAERWNSEFTED